MKYKCKRCGEESTSRNLLKCHRCNGDATEVSGLQSFEIEVIDDDSRSFSSSSSDSGSDGDLSGGGASGDY